jgi:hypothetical protein
LKISGQKIPLPGKYSRKKRAKNSIKHKNKKYNPYQMDNYETKTLSLTYKPTSPKKIQSDYIKCCIHEDQLTPEEEIEDPSNKRTFEIVDIQTKNLKNQQ